MQGSIPCPRKPRDTSKGIGVDADVAKALTKRTRSLWTVDHENVQAVRKEGG